MTINLGAYSTEIIRAGIQAVPKGHIEAGESLAMSRMQILRYVVLKQAFQKDLSGPLLADRDRDAGLGRGVADFGGRSDLCGELHPVAQLPRLRSLSASSTVLYLLLAIAARAILRGIGRWSFPKREEISA